MNDSEKNAMLVLQKMCDIKSTENTIVAETINTLYNLINRQQAEIDRLNIDLKAMRGAANSWKAEVQRICKKEFDNIEIDIEAVKSEAVREFTKKLKTEIAGLEVKSPSITYKCGIEDALYYRMPKIIDRLLEETGCNDE